MQIYRNNEQQEIFTQKNSEKIKRNKNWRETLQQLATVCPLSILIN